MQQCLVFITKEINKKGAKAGKVTSYRRMVVSERIINNIRIS